jgi:hypothetical protein
VPFPARQPCYLIPERKLGQKFCVPPFRMVCLYQTKRNDEDYNSKTVPKISYVWTDHNSHNIKWKNVSNCFPHKELIRADMLKNVIECPKICNRLFAQTTRRKYRHRIDPRSAAIRVSSSSVFLTSLLISGTPLFLTHYLQPKIGMVFA